MLSHPSRHMPRERLRWNCQTTSSTRQTKAHRKLKELFKKSNIRLKKEISTKTKRKKPSIRPRSGSTRSANFALKVCPMRCSILRGELHISSRTWCKIRQAPRSTLTPSHHLEREESAAWQRLSVRLDSGATGGSYLPLNLWSVLGNWRLIDESICSLAGETCSTQSIPPTEEYLRFTCSVRHIYRWSFRWKSKTC